MSELSRLMEREGRKACKQQSRAGKPLLLTGREKEVLRLVAVGRSNKEIAVELRISVKTVEKHRQQVLNKLGVSGIAPVVHYALSHGYANNMYAEVA